MRADPATAVAGAAAGANVRAKPAVDVLVAVVEAASALVPVRAITVRRAAHAGRGVADLTHDAAADAGHNLSAIVRALCTVAGARARVGDRLRRAAASA